MAIPTGIASTRTLTGIANAIRFQNGENRRYQPGEMTDAIEALDGTQEKYGMQYLPEEPFYGRMSVLPYTAIANAIRGQNGETRDYKPCEMADAIRELEWKKPEAYALLTYPKEGTNEQKLFFVMADEGSKLRSMYNGWPILEVYSGFEDAEYTSNSQVPWYSHHDDITAVEVCDATKELRVLVLYVSELHELRLGEAEYERSYELNFHVLLLLCCDRAGLARLCYEQREEPELHLLLLHQTGDLADG